MTASLPDSFPPGSSLNGSPLDRPPAGCPAHATGPDGVQRLYGPAASEDPAGLYERLRRDHGPVAPVLLEGDVPAWLVIGYNEVLEVARSPRRFSRDGRNWAAWQEGHVGNGSPIAPVLLWGPDCTHQDGAVHERLRSAVNESLDRFDRRGLRRHVQRYAHGLIDRFAADGRAEVLSQYAQQLPMLALTTVLGLPDEEGPRLVEASRQLLIGTEKAVTADAYIQDALRALVARKHEDPGHDLASWLVGHPADLSDEEVVHHLRLVLVAGNETTTNLIVNTLRVVLTHPKFRGSLHGGRMTLPAAVEQVLWDEPPIAVCPGGFATLDVELGGRPIAKGDVLLLGLAAANADPAVRPTPGAPMNGNRSHLAFTSGPHECPGQDIGRAITQTAIEVLLARLPDLGLTVEPEGLSWTASTWSRHLDALPVRFGPRPPERDAEADADADPEGGARADAAGEPGACDGGGGAAGEGGRVRRRVPDRAAAAAPARRGLRALLRRR
ncbi:cytochrome P450 [Streptomyces sp. NPDC049881]|uniref:cytochrome P450 n=1 Tax=Streptomyces sp. NPDC049881 TaxID=3155778 RepID=UPI003426A3DB